MASLLKLMAKALQLEGHDALGPKWLTLDCLASTRMSDSPFLDLEGNRIPGDQILGYGGTGIVLLRDQFAIKMPLRWARDSQADVDERLKVIKHEQDVYRRLGTYIASRNFLLNSDMSVVFCDFDNTSLMPIDINMEPADDDGYSIQTDIGQLGAVFFEIVTSERCNFDLFHGENMGGRIAEFPPWHRQPLAGANHRTMLDQRRVSKCCLLGGCFGFFLSRE
ncbi:predicted protein [Uncinocarpus reesii 1704]|uniref:Protein kinase domain-containing protein n=1 Tax=Uncinocarpus reesii (strain UAMH 1704) TaxID=336963 RepID=C4JTH9_UNCRE|nr:uncharacterized protein UREG_05768 [Uncinocarpus reesii 1704]EEP80926.1 predicted protein [Uncinocarpus reesii 1704]